MTNREFVTLTINAPVAYISIKREPVNSCNEVVWAQLLNHLISAESISSVRALVIQSLLTKDIFTAGNDINELYPPNTSFNQFEKFWRSQTLFLCRLYRSPLITIAMIRGACPAGGCILELCCDYRVQSIENEPTIGLNEVGLGISVPKYWIKIFNKTIGNQSLTEELLQKGKLLKVDQALNYGLIHAAVPKSELELTVTNELKQRLLLPDDGRIATKMFLRKELSLKWESECDEEAKRAWNSLSEEKTVMILGRVIERLKNRTQAKYKAKM